MKTWKFIDCDETRLLSLSEELGVSNLVSRLFCCRNLENDDVLYEIIKSDIFDINEFDKRLVVAKEQSEKVCVFGDYDVDGISSTVMMYSYLCERNIDSIYMLPSRFAEGYGLTSSIVDTLFRENVKLIITVDNGISAFNEIQYAKSIGIDVIVTDHHEVPDVLPPADVIIDPHMDSFKFHDFAGVGVVFKIIQSIEKEKCSLDSLISKYGDLLVLGTIGDLVPVNGENRGLLKKSIDMIMKSERPGIVALLEGRVFDSELDGSEISFGVVPILNACGRMESPETAINILLSKNLDEARYFLSTAIRMNEERKAGCSSIFEDVKLKIANKMSNRIIFESSENWNHGLIGIVCSSVSFKFGKPCILASIIDNEVRCSARSIDGFNIYEFLKDCSDLFIKFGGHPMAAGFTLPLCNLDEFKKRIFDLSSKIDIPFASIIIDSKIENSDMKPIILDEIQKLSPFGCGNSEPVFAVMHATLVKVISIGAGRHIRVVFKKDGKQFNATMFGVCPSEFLFKNNDIIDLAVRIKKNYFYGKKDIAIHIVDVKYSDIDIDQFVLDKRIFDDFISEIDNIPSDSVPTRDDFSRVFRFIKDNYPDYYSFRIDKLYLDLPSPKISLLKLYLILEVFNEIGIMSVEKDNDNYKVIINYKKKSSLENSKIFKRITKGDLVEQNCG